jgi:peptidyl-prolyl cis-trans isomerase C
MSDLRFRQCVWPAVAAVLTLSCGVREDALARVGDQRLEIEPFQAYVGEVAGETWQAVSARVTSGLLDQYIDRKVVVESARREEIDLSADSLSLGPSEVQWLLDELCGHAPEPSAEEIDAEVGRRAEETRPAKAHVRQLLVDTYEHGLEARRRLMEGEDFVEVSRQLSRAPNAADGGELGFFDEGSLPPEIDEVVFSLEPGEYSEPVQGPSGFHVFQVLESVPAGPPDIAEVEAAVRTEFAQKKMREHTLECIRGLGAEIGVEIYEEHLWFPYTGRYAEDIDA